MNAENIIHQIESHKKYRPHQVHNGLAIGDSLYRNLHPGMFMYVIDSLDVDLAICSRSATAYKFLLGVSRLKQFDSQAWKTFFVPTRRNRDGKMICPLSEVVDCGYGECLEKSLLFHLHEQGNDREVYTVWGLLEYRDSVSGNQISHTHAWNVVARADGMYLVDMQNPLVSKYRKDDRACVHGSEVGMIPFVQQISGIQNGNFILPHFRRWRYRFEFLRCEKDL